MNAAQMAADFTAGQEGYRGHAYWDANGYAVGYGNHYYEDGIAVQASDTISQEDALDLLHFYTQQNINAIQAQLARPISTGLMAALADLRYNCGTITMALLNLINSGAALDTIRDKYLQTCITSQGQVLQVLIDRRQEAWQELALGSDTGTNKALVGGAVIVGAAILVAYLNRKKAA